jgi:virginiamycin A acetyltransferase
MTMPDPDQPFPVPGFDVTYVRPTVTRAGLEVGRFTYYSGRDFQAQVTHHYPESYGDQLIIGQFCQIAQGVEFVMNGANHQMNAATCFPFHILTGWEAPPPDLADLPCKGDTVIGHDVWIGQNAVILPGVRVGDGAIIGAYSVVGSDVAAYTVVAGDPARPIRRRFDDEMVDLLERLRWWDLPVEQIKVLIPTLTNPDLEQVKRSIRRRLGE